MNPTFEKYIEYYNQLTPATVAKLRDLCVADLHFIDPFNDVRGVDKVEKIFTEMFHKVKEPTFRITDAIEKDKLLVVRWDFRFRLWLIRGGQPHLVTGVSFVERNEEGKIVSHIDYWDASSQLYLHLPLIGWIVWGMRRLLA